MLPESIHNSIEAHLDDTIVSGQSVAGGDINQAQKLTLGSGRTAFLKWNETAPEGMFDTEAQGLEMLQTADTNLFIPRVLALSDNYLLLEWVDEGNGDENASFEFGIQLARLHQKSQPTFGLGHDNYIGKLRQSNTKHSNWPDFFALERIEPQIKLGIETNKLTRSILFKVEQLYKKLGALFPQEQPALLHGDLWSGNYMFTKLGRTSIYDPAVYYGHREMDIAMTRLFGGFSENFYEGYNSEFPLEDGIESRVNLCNLYPVLVHANLFGGSYCRQAEHIINHYA